MTTERPVEVGVFSSVDDANQVVAELLANGFSKNEITVICSDDNKERWFREFEHQEPSGAHTPMATAAGGTLGAALGGLSVLALGAATGGVGLIAAGGLAAWSGAIVGGLVGAMMTRGFEREVADYYDQSVQQGKLLIAVECHDDHAIERLARAAEILAAHGAEPMPLREG